MHFILPLLLTLLNQPAFAVETEALFDGTGVGDWSTSRDSQRLASEFSLSEVKAATDPAALEWRFVSRGIAFNDLFLMRPISRRFSAIRVHVRNAGAALNFAAKVRDNSGAEWTVPPVALQQGDWRWVEFPFDQWKVASWSRDADGKLDFPLASFTLIAFDLQAGPEYHLFVDRIELTRPDPPVATVTDLALPTTLRAGQTYSLKLAFSLDQPCHDDGAFLAFRRGKSVLLRVPLALPTPLTKLAPGQRVDIPAVPVKLPLYAFGGEHTAVLQLGDARVEQAGQNLSEEGLKVTIQQRIPGKTVSEVKLHNGTPTLFINGKPHNGMAWATYGPTSEVFRDFTQAGIDLYTFAGTPTEAGYGLSQTTWTAPDQYDYSQFDQRVLMLLQENPNAYFFPRLYVHAPKWWSALHPDDLVLVDPGDGKPVPFIHAGDKPAPSWASEAWRKDTIEGLRRMIAHIEASPYADRIIGYHIASGTTEEWMMWGGNEDEWVDYSPVNLAKFRDWLRGRYTTDAALQAAWHDPAVTLASAAIPTKAQRNRTAFGSLRDPAQEQAVIDYYLYNSHLVADTICTFAKAIKDLTHREKITGFFYGYLLQLCGEQRQQNAGHLGLEEVLASPDVDFLCSPTSYAFRQLGGEGTSHFMSLFESAKLHGKLWFDENDIRTSLSGGAVGEWGRPADVAGDILQQDKELANCIVNGSAQWWFDVGANKYNDPALMARIGKLATKATAAQDLDRTSADEVAMVVDEKSLCSLRVSDPLGAWLLVSQLPALHRIGAPVGHYLVTDLPKLQDKKLFLIMTSFAPTAADRQAIDALKRDGHVLVFFYAPGLYRDGQLDESAMQDFTGIRLRLSKDPAALHVTLQAGHPLTDSLAGQSYGADSRTFPIVTADDPQATVLGTLADGRAAFVVKPHENWTAIYSITAPLPTNLLRRMAQLAGVHLYIDTEDVTYATRDLLAVVANQPGPRQIHLPRQATVTDLYTNEPVAQATDTFTADFAKDATRVFVLK